MTTHEPLHKADKAAVSALFDAFPQKKIVVVGDVMLDSYTYGRVDRISPEAPVPVVLAQKHDYRLGGAANVAINLRRLGAKVSLCSIIGKDVEGLRIVKMLEEEGILPCLVKTERPTTVKTRIMSGRNQLLRIDQEVDHSINAQESGELVQKVAAQLADADVLVFEDYDKGTLHPELISAIVAACKEAGVAVVVDPKKRNFFHYSGVDVFKPNLRELAEGLNIHLSDKGFFEDLQKAAEALVEKLGCRYAFVTLSEKGVYLHGPDVQLVIPAHIRSVYDVSGAGDTVISVMAMAMAAKADMALAASLANLAGGLVCEKAGVVPIELAELREEALQYAQA